MSLSERFDRLDTYIREDRILRHRWEDTDADGRARACLLSAIAPEVLEEDGGRIGSCPAEVMPAWLAYLTPELDDRTSESSWREIIRRYAHVVRRAALSLDVHGWHRAHCSAALAVLAEARRNPLHVHAQQDGVLDRVCARLRREIEGDDLPRSEWRDALAEVQALSQRRWREYDSHHHALTYPMLHNVLGAKAWLVSAIECIVLSRMDQKHHLRDAASSVARAASLHPGGEGASHFEVGLGSVRMQESWDRISYGVLDAILEHVVAAERANKE